MNDGIADMRINYSRKSLNETDVDKDPIVQFKNWWDEAVMSQLLEPNAMTLATSSASGHPSARIVLLKGFSSEGFIFYTNYDSNKGLQLAENPKASLVFFWKELERQVRINGVVEKTSSEQSDTYFYSRPEKSQVGAIASPQSKVIANREWIEEQFESHHGETRRPDHWGGYIVKPVIIEFWQGRRSRLHDRLQYTLIEDNQWKIERLAP